MKKRALRAVLPAVIAIALVSYTLGQEILAGRTPSLFSFALINFSGYLFFLLMPVEALVPIYQAEGHAGATLILIAVPTAVAAQVIDYCIGRAVSERVIFNLIGEKRYMRFRDKIENWGGWVILLFNLFPLASSVLLLVAGMMRYSARRALLYSLTGLVIKYFTIVYLFDLASSWIA
tara:strand:- start:113 stop:643 length:531 start_codon:yes stop_codon:yes gene_type:complete